MAANSSDSNLTDPCGEIGPTQVRAILWFICVLFIGLGLMRVLRDTDSYNYATNGEFYDYAAYRSNRLGQSHIKSEFVDARAQGDYATAVSHLND